MSQLSSILNNGRATRILNYNSPGINIFECVKDLNARLTDTDNELEDLKKSVEKVKKQVDDFLGEVEDLDARLISVEVENAELKGYLIKLEIELENLKYK